MRRLLYIPVNSKTEDQSVSKTIGRAFVDTWMERTSEYEMVELDLYREYIPELNAKFFRSRAQLVTGDAYSALGKEEQGAVDRINQLCDQFLSADMYVIAAPMWSVFFPSILKRYLDCVIQHGKVIYVSSEKVEGLLDNKERNMVYIQSSGGVYPALVSAKFNHGVNYLHDIFKFLGVQRFEKIMVEGVDTPKVGREKAIQKAHEDIDKVIGKLLQ